MAENQAPKNNKNGEKRPASTTFLTALVIGLFAVLGVIITTLLWSNQLTDNAKISDSFYTTGESSAKKVDSSKKSKDKNSKDDKSKNNTAEEKKSDSDSDKAKKEAEDKAKKDAEDKAKKEAEDKAKKEAEDKAKKEAEDKEANAGDSTTVEAGEGVNQIAARTGIPASQIAAANGMTVDSWFAYPGQVVKLK
ncbi:LysM peptidoglycan-binding domain-containing protein [Floricoccus penangensis]|uniref:LysM peptidoglycan-binding domain-containing protein n=1 Tax=Floricoccus penangensis TaxID=1859475 RepID=UPI00203FB8DE|nr:LysM domain-containing protein [Floricoccus penangensis]URZ86780.1 LysM peptidoglycan-binding domain-containing protein [Floricoccus penangensis]